MSSLLPLNSTPLERALEAALDEHIEVPLRSLYNPDTCPAPLLPHLAWSWSVDRWSDAWPEATKRAVCRSAFFVHSRKGTIGAIRRVVEPLGYLLDVIEWWQVQPMDTPATFSLEVGVRETGISEAAYNELVALIDDAKPLSRHLKNLNISLETPVQCRVGIAVYDGDQIDVLPWENPDIDVRLPAFHGASHFIHDQMDITLNG